MNTRNTLLALAALTATSIAALAPTSASAWGMGGYGHHMGMGGYGHHMGGYGGYRPMYRNFGFGRSAGFYGNDYGRWNVWRPRPVYTPTVSENCECEAPVRYVPPVAEHCACEAPAPVVHKVYVPVRVPVRVEVPVPYRVEVPVPVRVPVRVYVPVKSAEPCDCEAPVVKRQTYVAPAPASTEPCDCEEPGVQRQTYAQPQEQEMEGQQEEPSQDKTARYAARDLQK